MITFSYPLHFIQSYSKFSLPLDYIDHHGHQNWVYLNWRFWKVKVFFTYWKCPLRSLIRNFDSIWIWTFGQKFWFSYWIDCQLQQQWELKRIKIIYKTKKATITTTLELKPCNWWTLIQIRNWTGIMMIKVTMRKKRKRKKVSWMRRKKRIKFTEFFFSSSSINGTCNEQKKKEFFYFLHNQDVLSWIEK